MTLNVAAKRQLFIEMASRPEGTTVNDVYVAAVAQGSSETVEAFHNLGRRLARSGRFYVDDKASPKVYHAKEDRDGAWIDEDYLQGIVDPEHPMESLAVLREASRQMRTIPGEAWRAAAEILQGTNARVATANAIAAYVDELIDGLEELARIQSNKPDHTPAELERARRRCAGRIEMLTHLCRDGLGLSRDAVHIPNTPEAGLRDLEHKIPFVNPGLLQDEISRRVEDAPMLMAMPAPGKDHDLIVAGVDGSTQGGLLSLDGTAGDFVFGAAPQINLNTAAAVLNLEHQRESGNQHVFLRLPSAPEDIQRKENTYAIMSPLFFPDLSQSEYMHSAWNAMDVLESRVTRAALDTWYTPRTDIEVRPADVVIRDGTVVPNDRDPSHYAQVGTYGRIVRELVRLSWETARKCRDDAQTVAGSVKNSQMRVVGPIANHVIAQAAGLPNTNLRSWALDEMNAVPDQKLLSRLLSSMPHAKWFWTRSAIFMRPFHATTPAYSRYYTRDPDRAPAREIERAIDEARKTPPEKRSSNQHGWADIRHPNPYSQMLDGVWFAGFFAIPDLALGKGQALPRLELMIPAPTREENAFPDVVHQHRDRLLAAIATTGFEVAQDHDMFGAAGTIDFVPRMLKLAHDTVLAFARDMRGRAGEYLDRLLAKEIGMRKRQTVRVRPWKPEELQAWKERMDRSRDDRDEPRRIRTN